MSSAAISFVHARELTNITSCKTGYIRFGYLGQLIKNHKVPSSCSGNTRRIINQQQYRDISQLSSVDEERFIPLRTTRASGQNVGS